MSTDSAQSSSSSALPSAVAGTESSSSHRSLNTPPMLAKSQGDCPSPLRFQGFDPQHPPNPEHIDACVHCGFCLVTCPSYRILGTEMDSPRGRIYLMDGVHTEQISLNTATAQHFDTCLGCLACTTACPSGVPYDQLLASMRPQLERNQPRTMGDRLFRQLIFSLFPYPNRLRWLLVPLFLYQKSGLQAFVRSNPLFQKKFPRLAAMESILPEVTMDSLTAGARMVKQRVEAENQSSITPDALDESDCPAGITVISAQGQKRYRVGMLLGCVQQLFFSNVNLATARVLTANGCEVVIPNAQGCCAALPYHQGQETQAQDLARQMIDHFEETNVDAIIINAAGCGHTLKDYDHILHDDPDYRAKAIAFSNKVKDVQEFLASIELTASFHPLQSEPLTVVYQDACHLLHGQKISVQPRQLLNHIPNVHLKEPLDAALCCGSAGVYNMLQPDVADELGQQKVTHLLNTGASIIASPNPGCSLQIQKHLQAQGKQVSLFHPIELLDRSIRGLVF